MNLLKRCRRVTRVAVPFVTALAAAIVLTGFPAGAHSGYDKGSIKGRWGFLEEFRTADRYGTAIGIIEFDGRGGCTVDGIKNGGDAVEATDYGGDCSYTLTRGGRGTVTGGAVPDWSFAMAEHGRAIVFMRTERADVGRGEMRPMGREPVTAASIKGRWSFLHPADLAGVYDVSVGSISFDGKKTCVIKYTENGGPYQTGARESAFECAYTVARSGWGEIGGEPMVVTDGGATIYNMHVVVPGNLGWMEFTRM